MALNLGETLRDAVDGPALDELVDEDPADVDLPALSARIRHRRRARATTRAAAGVAAAGAVALVGVHGLDRVGVEGVASPLSQAQQRLCGLDVTRMPRVAGPQLVRASEPVVLGAAGTVTVDGAPSSLGSLVGRTLTTIVVSPPAASGTAALPSNGTVALTANASVVAVGVIRDEAAVATDRQGAASVSAVSSDLSPCPTSAGTPARVPAGSYSVQYVWDRSSSGGTLVRSSAGPWTVTLSDQPAPVTLPAGFPSDEVPVVGGTLVSVTSDTSSDDGSTSAWTVQVAVDGDDGATRAAAALRAAGATVADPLGFVASDATASAGDGMATPSTAVGSRAVLAALQARRLSALAAVTAAQGTYDSLVAAQAAPDALQWAARTLQAARAEVTDLDGQIAEAELALSTSAAEAALAERQAEQDQARAAAQAAATFRLAGTDGFTAVTHSWTVQVAQDGRTTDPRRTLTYTLTHL